MPLVIREHQERDLQALRACIVALQEFERAIDPRMPAGEAMADAYWEHIEVRCREAHGRVLVADLDGVVVGFATILTREPFTDLDDPPGTYAVVNDLAVLPGHRRRGIGRTLLEHAEAFARAEGATQLRINLLAKNQAARRLYLGVGFEPHLEVFEKQWHA